MEWQLQEDGEFPSDAAYDDDLCPKPAPLSAEQRAMVFRLQQKLKLQYHAEPLTILRFCRAREWQEDKVEAMLLAAEEWRASLQPMDERQQRKWQLYKACRHVFLHEHTDKFGRPVFYIWAANMDPNAWILEPLDDIIQGVVEVMMEAWERAKQSPHGKLVIAFNFNGFSRRNSNIPWVKALIPVVQDYFPEMVASFLLMDSPWIVWGLYNIVKPFLDRNTRAKVRFVKREELTNYLEPRDVPVVLGGEWEYEPEYNMFELPDE